MSQDERQIVSIVDDDESLRRSVRNLLTSVGFRVETFESAEAFLQSAERVHTGCVVLDLRMPGMSGLDLMIELRRRRIDIPVILMTGHTDEHSLQGLEAERPFGFLEKPFSIKDLRALVERWRATLTPGAS